MSVPPIISIRMVFGGCNTSLGLRRSDPLFGTIPLGRPLTRASRPLDGQAFPGCRGPRRLLCMGLFSIFLGSAAEFQRIAGLLLPPLRRRARGIDDVVDLLAPAQ